ncbi:MAG TPA: hypothetical protein VHU19_08035 [Pyrinomonadaceae bacterium]|nr:hypothetical protein [Pyrinomonadaceae bacterium]
MPVNFRALAGAVVNPTWPSAPAAATPLSKQVSQRLDKVAV